MEVSNGFTFPFTRSRPPKRRPRSSRSTKVARRLKTKVDPAVPGVKEASSSDQEESNFEQQNLRIEETILPAHFKGNRRILEKW